MTTMPFGALLDVSSSPRSLASRLFGAAFVLVGCGTTHADVTAQAGQEPPGQQAGRDVLSAIITSTGPVTGVAPLTVTLSGNESTGEITSYEWDCKDHTAVATGSTLTRAFPVPGTYDVTLTVKDRSGNASSSSLAVTVSPSAKLLFKSNFGPGVSLSAPKDILPSQAFQYFSGTDAETGFRFPIAALGAQYVGLQLIGPYNSDGPATGTALTADNVDDYFQNQIRQVKGPHGILVYEVFENLKIKEEPVGDAFSQIPFLINRPWTIGDVKDLYITYWFKHQADLVSKLDQTVPAGNWRVQFEFKTGGYNNGYQGDYRIKTEIIRSTTDGALYWRTRGDNVANGPWKTVTYWTIPNSTVPVPVDEWFKFEIFWHRSSGDDGRYWSAVNGQVIADHKGPNMGDYGLPITRIMLHNAYSGGTAAVQGHLTGLELWDRFPCGDGNSCYVPP